MKKFLNILFALTALGLIVACSPAGNAKTRLKKRPDPVRPDPDPKPDPEDPEKPIWDDDPEEILTQKGFAWFGTSFNDYPPDDPYDDPDVELPCDFWFMGFYKEDGQLYVYYNYNANQAYYPKNAKATWENTLQRGVINVGTNRTRGWHKVIWDNNDKYKFTIPTINGAYTNGTYNYTFKLDIEDKALKVYHNAPNCTGIVGRRTDCYKWYLDPRIPELTPQMKALMPKEDGLNKRWSVENSDPSLKPMEKCSWRDERCVFYYDEATQRLYHYCHENDDKVVKALGTRNFNSEVRWQLVYPDPYGNPNVFYTIGPDWNLKYTLNPKHRTPERPYGLLDFEVYDYQENGRNYCEDRDLNAGLFRGVRRNGTVDQPNMYRMH